MADNLLISWEI